MIIRTLMLVLGLSVMSPAAFAACVQADGAGTWRVFIHLSDESWLSCNVTVKNRGAYDTDTSTCKISSGSSANITGGSLKIQNSCRVSGTIKLALTLRIVEAQLSRDKTTMDGVGTFGDSGEFTFAAVKK